MVTRANRPSYARSCPSTRGSRRAPAASCRVLAPGLERGPANKGKAGSQERHPEVHEPSCSGTLVGGAPEHLEVCRAAVCQSVTSRQSRSEVVCPIWWIAEDPGGPCRGWVEIARLRPGNQCTLPT